MIIYILIIMLSISSALACMNTLPSDIIAQIVSKPDIKEIYKIIEIQEKINRFQPIYHLDHPLFGKSKPQSFFKIRQALFPYFALIKTCKTYYMSTFKNSVAKLSKEILYPIFPQGIVPFLFPKQTQVDLLSQQFIEEENLINTLLHCCLQENNIDQNFIEETVFFTLDLFKTVATTSAFQDLLNKYTLTHRYDDKLKQHSICDKSNTSIIAYFEEIDCSFPKLFFNITESNRTKYEPLCRIFIEFCIKNIKIPTSINTINYSIRFNQVFSFTLIERILWHLTIYINDASKGLGLQCSLNRTTLQIIFKNFFTVLDFLCSLDEVDLSLPATSFNGTIAHKIVYEFEKNDYPIDFLSSHTQEKIQSCLNDRTSCSTDSPQEKKAIIDVLVDLFLLNVTDLHKE